MTARINLAQALKGAKSPVAHLRWRYTCSCCGCEDFNGGYPLAVACVQCGERVEAEENEEYEQPVSMLTAMNNLAPANDDSDVKITPLVDFYIGTSFSIQALEEDLLTLAAHVLDLRRTHTDKSAISMKLCADDVAKLAGQISKLASHLAGATEKFVNREPRNGSAT